MATTNVAASTITALLGPTNTGKTHRAVERMLEHESGMIGLPLRLLAREVYDRISAKIGEAPVALVTGEEKRVPPHARYWVCTVEAMPREREVDFVAVDEIQLAAHPQRGHVFTERLLSTRGARETWFLGAETMRPIVERLVPTARVMSHPRLSKLSGIGAQSMGALPPRSAVVVFSTPRVYELAERIRRRRGGAAVVLGALSPRARNAQVAMFQSGEVDYMVATDAIGMGLNLDLDHVAFADLRKFDGKETRPLEAAELAQIAGRAGRHLNDGTFSTLAPLPALPDRLTHAIEGHHFPPVRQVVWRNADLDTTSVVTLLASLRQSPRAGCLRLVERADDFDALSALAERPEIRQRTTRPEHVSLLWEVCQVPDYRQLLLDHHANLVADIFVQLTDRGRIDPDWLAAQIRRVDDPVGDIDTLLMRMESVRTWTYVSSHVGWVDDAEHFQAIARAVEDRLGDALHQALVERFVDQSRQSKTRAHRPRRRAHPVSGEPVDVVADHPFGKLLELRAAMVDAGPEQSPPDAIEELVLAPHERFRVESSGVIVDTTDHGALAVMTRGSDLLHPEVRVTFDSIGSGARSRVQRRLVAWARDAVSELLSPLRAPALGALTPAARGLLYQLEQQLGTVLTRDARAQLDASSDEDRRLLQHAGIELGRRVVYARSLLRAPALELRSALISAWVPDRVVRLPPGAVSVAVAADAPKQTYLALGYPVLGPRAIRADVAEKVARALLGADPRPDLPRIASWLGCPRGDVVRVLAALGVEARRPRRARRRPERHDA